MIIDRSFNEFGTILWVGRSGVRLAVGDQEQSIRDAEIAPEKYYPKGYQPDLLPFWPSEKPLFLPESMVPEQMKKKGKDAAQ